MIGLAKDLPPAEMEALLLANIDVADDAMQQLAVRRGVAVRDYLATREHRRSSRLFLGAPKDGERRRRLDAARRPEAGRHLSEPSACRAAFLGGEIETRAATGCRSLLAPVREAVATAGRRRRTRIAGAGSAG